MANAGRDRAALECGAAVVQFPVASVQARVEQAAESLAAVGA